MKDIISPKIKYKTFEQCLDEINVEIAKRASRWQLSGIPSVSFEDVSQIIRIHIFRKWNLYDQKRPLIKWVNTVISNQIRNIVRNLYGNYSRPCLSCKCNEGGNLCSIYGTQNNQCPMLAYWEKNKKNAHDIKLAVTLENHSQEVSNQISDYMDIDKTSAELHKKMETILKPIEWKVYKHLYIKHGEEQDLGRILGFKTTEKGRTVGYKQLSNIKKSIIAKVKKLLANDEIDMF